MNHIELQHEMSNNVVEATSKVSDQLSDQSLCKSLEHSMTIKRLTEQHLEFGSLKGGCTGSSEFTTVKMPHCRKSHVAAHIILFGIQLFIGLGLLSLKDIEDITAGVLVIY